MRYFCLCAVLTILTAFNAISQPISSPTQFISQNFDIEHYNVVVATAPTASKNIAGRCDVIVTWLKDVETPLLPIHLRGPQIDSVVLDGSRLEFYSVGTITADTFHFDVTRGQGVRQDQRDTFHIYYQGMMADEGGTNPWGGVHFQDTILYALGVGFRNSWVSTTQSWMPCYDHPSDKATFTLSMTVPKGYSVASVGKLMDVSTSADELSTTFIWEETHKTATYLLTFAVGKLVQLGFDSGNPNLPISIFSKPRDTLASRVSYRLLPKMLQAFESRFGAYPFDKIGYVNTTIGAMEHQTMISFPVSVVNRFDTVNTTAAHELAHQWYGDWVSPLDFRHAWLTESFATFCESVWMESLRGWDAYLTSVEKNSVDYINRTSKGEGVFPLFDFPRAKPSSNYPETIYKKGAVVLAMARALMGDEAFYEALRTYLEDNAEGNSTTDIMKEALRPGLGDVTTPFFDEWVYGKGWPQLLVNVYPNGTSWTARIEQAQQLEHSDWPLFTTLPLNVIYRDAASNAIVDTIIIFNNKTIEFPIKSPLDLAINTGQKCRSLVEILSITSVTDATTPVPIVAIFPNPADHTLEIRRSLIADPATVEVVDISGRTIHTASLRDNQSSITLSTTDWPSGVYYITLTHPHSATTVPVVIGH
ncbi:MAG: T9SS type A sorting domain-containing protein [Ignavibacteria bacterium]|nr:T9SS type A sorting domain-containing protein [Ignavibacteria bacterium]